MIGEEPVFKGDGPLIVLIAGEPSGDVLGGRLMAALKRQQAVRFAGVGGPNMAAEGLQSLFPMAELSIMGLAEVLPHVPHLLGRIRETVAEITRLRPAAVITIDSPGFNFRVAKRLEGLDAPIIHYVAPTVWAWRPGRARKIATFLDHLLALLPFEPPYFDAVHLPCTFVGHPVVESGADEGDGQAMRQRHGIGATDPLICLLPGSRRSETSRLLPVFSDTLALLVAVRPNLRAVIAVAGDVAPDVREAIATWPGRPVVVSDDGDKYGAFAAADVALAASGTVVLELAMAGTPTIVTYKVNALSAWLARRIIRVPYVNLVNIVLGREAVPELLQEDCQPDKLADAVERLLDDEFVRRQQKEASKEALSRLGGEGGVSPSNRAARVVLDLISDRSKA